MTLLFMVLFGIGLSMGNKKAGLTRNLPVPIIWAEPDSVITSGATVNIWCQGSFEALEYCLDKEGSLSPLYRVTPLENTNKVNFTISFLSGDHSGRYRCYYYYLNSAGHSERSDPLELVVTGFYRKPTISVLSSSAETSGWKMNIQCDSSMGYDRFILTEEGEHKQLRKIHAQNVHHEQFQALFSVGPVTFGQTWTWKCYGNYRFDPYVWSISSDSLKLLVSESHSHGQRVENLIRITMAALVLATLGILLFQAYHIQRRKREHNDYI